MQEAVKKKLKSNHGASMMLAMALFLVCTMVSAIIVSTAASGMSRNEKREAQQNAYLAVSSAADFLMGELEQVGTYVGITVKKEYGCRDCSIASTMQYFDEWVSGYRLDARFIQNPLDDGHLMVPNSHDMVNEDRQTDVENTQLNGKLGAMFLRGADKVYTSGMKYCEQMQIALQETDTPMPVVLCDVTMETDYDVTLVVYADGYDYAVTISLDGKAVLRDPISIPDNSDVHTVYYKKFNEATGAFSDTKIQLEIPAQIITTSTDISWGTPTIEKGGLSQ